MVDKLTHLKQLEAESIHIIREVAAEFDNPVMLYSIGKDSAVMLHLARKAFFPGKLPFPVMHVDTSGNSRRCTVPRQDGRELGLDLITHVNPDGVAQGINPFTHGSAKHTDIMKTEGLKQALDKHGFDAAFGGARRDEEKSRAKERVYSFRDSKHRWDPKNQRPSCGTSTTARSTRASRSACSRCRTGPNWTSGSTSTLKASRSCRCTSPPSVKSSRRTAP
jgi:sulfate adenylyltransferase subunit 2